ncbi:hypothetical protein [Companilactobacillus farciminis]|uniref:hypothetical protein n=1 Tax=Companilactobacillus farciminis TaxID=1612 RepID=UPI00232E92C8|nr:hypothetical protein [Companilactobacillus farciminis]WCG36006.1 hypothetical protein PML84_02155 [Companilactobacillus farciminis]
MILWLMFSKQEALFSALTSLTTLVITVTCTYFQYKLTLIDKSNIDKQKARPEIEVTELAKNNKTKNLSLKFLLRSRTLQTLINVNGEIFLSIDQNANNYEFQKHFDNIGSSPSSKIMNAVIDLDDSNPTEKKVLENEITGFEYLIYFKTISLESCVAVYLHGTDSYMAYYSKKDKTWYKYNHTDKSIPKDQIGIIEKNQK